LRGGRRLVLAALAVLTAGSVGVGQEWAERMLDHTSHDFGTVNHGSRVEHKFVLTNIYLEDARIAALRPSCHCFRAWADRSELKTWEKAEITVATDTRAFSGARNATVTVVLDRPFPAEVRLDLRGFIRGDLMIQPDAIALGTLRQGHSDWKKAVLTHAGRSDWRITRIDVGSPYLHVWAIPTAAGEDRISYDLWVRLKQDVPRGSFAGQFTLVTNDGAAPAARIPVPVTGNVTAAAGPVVSVPDILVPAGESVTQRIVVHGDKPFEILRVQSPDSRLRFAWPEKSDTVQVVTATYTAGTAEENVATTARFETSDPDAPVVEAPVKVYVRARHLVAFPDR
jgi:hypothetical protein